MTNSPRSCMAILGNGLTRDQKLFPHVVERLNSFVELYNKRPAEDKPLLAVIGKWSFWNRKGTPPVTTEAEEMKNFLIATEKLPQEAINTMLVENQSEDTIGNALHLKILLEEKGIKKVSLLCAEHQVERAGYIFVRIFGEGFKLDVIATPGPYEGNELEKQKAAQRTLLERQIPFIDILKSHPRPLKLLEEDYLRQLASEEPLSDTAKTALGIVEPREESELVGNSGRRK
jgi:hypothetical protein